MKITTFIKECKENEEIASLLKEKAIKQGFILDDQNPDVVVFIGGDGTFLKAVHKYFDLLDRVLFIGINKGQVGFFYEFYSDDIDSLLLLVEEGDYETSSYPMLQAKYCSKTVYAINEIRIENPFRTLISDIYISDTYLENYRGNGLVVCSAIGSSAYNKSLGGSIILPSLPVMELTEVAAISNNIYHSLGSSLVLDKEEKIRLKCNMENVVIGYDNFTDVAKEGKEMEISISDKSAKVIHSKGFRYFDKLNQTFIR